MRWRDGSLGALGVRRLPPMAGRRADQGLFARWPDGLRQRDRRFGGFLGGRVGAACLLGLALLGSLATEATEAAATSSLTQARKDLLVLADMPAGWKSTKNPNTNDDTLGDTQLAHCMGVARSLITENPPSVNSPEFQNAEGTLDVADNVTVFPSAKNAAAEEAIGSNPKYPPCMTALASGPLKAKLFGKVPKGTTIGTPLVSPVDPSAFGQGIVGFSMSVPITSQGIAINYNVTQLLVVKGRLGHQVIFTAVGTPFSVALEQQIMVMAARQL
jgi:hypothetical protein